MRGVASRLAGPARLLAGLLALAGAAGALVVARGPGRGTTYAGSSAAGAALMVGAGAGLAVAGVATSFLRRSGRTGDLALLAGFTWCAPAFVAWQGGPPLVRTIAMVLNQFTLALVLHLAVAYPSGRVSSPLVRALVAVVYLESVLAAAALALFENPYLEPSCWANCSVNSFLVHPLPSFAHAIRLGDSWFDAAAAVALIGVCAARLRRAPRRIAAVAVPALAFAVAVIGSAVALRYTTIEDPFDTALFASFALAAAALILLAAGLLSGAVRTRVARRAVQRTVAELGEAPAPGALDAALASALGDPDLRIVYPVGREDAHRAHAGRARTRLVRGDRTVAVIDHAGSVAELEGQLGPAIRLALENARLQAEVLAQLAELQASRARIVEAGDRERRTLERDLHDGAQQHLLALSYDIRGARAGAHDDGDTVTEAALGRALRQTQDALEQLRDLAQGIFPAVLAEAGLPAALQSLADAAPIPVEILAGVHERCPARIESAAYAAVLHAVEDATSRGAGHLSVTVTREDGRLLLHLEDDGRERGPTAVAIRDRVGAVGGRVADTPDRCRLELPCA